MHVVETASWLRTWGGTWRIWKNEKPNSLFSAQNSTCLIRNKVFEFETHTHTQRLTIRAIWNFLGTKLSGFKVQTGTTASAAAAAATNGNFVPFLFARLRLLHVSLSRVASAMSLFSFLSFFISIFRRSKHLILNRVHSLRHSKTSYSISCCRQYCGFAGAKANKRNEWERAPSWGHEFGLWQSNFFRVHSSLMGAKCERFLHRFFLSNQKYSLATPHTVRTTPSALFSWTAPTRYGCFCIGQLHLFCSVFACCA